MFLLLLLHPAVVVAGVGVVVAVVGVVVAVVVVDVVAFAVAVATPLFLPLVVEGA